MFQNASTDNKTTTDYIKVKTVKLLLRQSSAEVDQQQIIYYYITEINMCAVVLVLQCFRSPLISNTLFLNVRTQKPGKEQETTFEDVERTISHYSDTL